MHRAPVVWLSGFQYNIKSRRCQWSRRGDSKDLGKPIACSQRWSVRSRCTFFLGFNIREIARLPLLERAEADSEGESVPGRKGRPVEPFGRPEPAFIQWAIPLVMLERTAALGTRGLGRASIAQMFYRVKVSVTMIGEAGGRRASRNDAGGEAPRYTRVWTWPSIAFQQ